MSKFTGDWKDKLSKEIGEEIYENGTVIGKSYPEKGSEWICWEYKDNYYISLDFTDWWEADEKDIETYNETK